VITINHEFCKKNPAKKYEILFSADIFSDIGEVRKAKVWQRTKAMSCFIPDLPID
jgi:hypothetical protein